MPELPEVETTRAGIAAHIINKKIQCVVIRDARLRWPVPANLAAICEGQRVESVSRRGKYLLLQLAHGTILVHLGMSGSLRWVNNGEAARKHDHVEFQFARGASLRFHDPRRFGCVLFTETPEQHELLRDLGPEPLSESFDADYLYARLRGRQAPIKHLIMDSHIVVGVGNIYAAECLFLSGISPRRAGARVSRERCVWLVQHIKQVLAAAIQRGGTTLRDFVNSEGEPGYFAQELLVYGRAGAPCRRCNTALKEIRQQQRSTVYCPTCQT